MLLDFFVLGEIPGTHIQITFSWVLTLAIIIGALIGAGYCYLVFWLNKQTAEAPAKRKTAKA